MGAISKALLVFCVTLAVSWAVTAGLRQIPGALINLVFNVTPKLYDDYREPILDALRRRHIDAQTALPGDMAPESVDYIVHATGGPIVDFGPYSHARAVLSLWAGVEKIVGNTTLTQPLCRMVDDGLRRGMVEWVAGHVLRAHLGTDHYVRQKPVNWEQHVPAVLLPVPFCVIDGARREIRVPVLDDDGVIVADSNAILIYVAKKFARTDWAPEDAAGAAAVQNAPAQTGTPQYDAVVIGAGVAGLYQTYRLNEAAKLADENE
eukprot:gene7685-10384_t